MHPFLIPDATVPQLLNTFSNTERGEDTRPPPPIHNCRAVMMDKVVLKPLFPTGKPETLIPRKTSISNTACAVKVSNNSRENLVPVEVLDQETKRLWRRNSYHYNTTCPKMLHCWKIMSQKKATYYFLLPKLSLF